MIYLNLDLAEVSPVNDPRKIAVTDVGATLARLSSGKLKPGVSIGPPGRLHLTNGTGYTCNWMRHSRGSCVGSSLRMASEIWSQILSGWTSVTDSGV